MPPGWPAVFESLKASGSGELRAKAEQLSVTFGVEPKSAWRLEVDPAATADQRAHLQSWLTGAH